MTECLLDRTLLGFVEGTLGTPDRMRALEHMSACEDCRVLLAEVTKSAFRLDPVEDGPGRLLGGRYALLHVMGAGALGIVYAAYDTKLERRVALKVLRHDGEAHGLTREARAMARLSHRNLVTVLDVLRTEGKTVLVMECVAGVSGAEWTGSSRRSLREVLAVYRQVADGLAAAHAAGLVHRDVKPENVLIGDDGVAKLADFGLAEVLSPAAPGGLSGTLAYMAPERLRGEPASPSSDQFAFWVSLCESLTGARPFRGTNASELLAAAAKGPTLPAAEIPSWLRRAIARGLSIEPGLRFGSMAECAAVLGRHRLRPLAVAAAGTIALLGLLAGRATTVPPSPCASIDARADGVWDARAKADARRAFQASSLPYGGDAWRSTEAALDAYWGAWRSEAHAACGARASGGASPLADARARCVDVRWNRFAALASLVREGGDATIERAVEASLALPRVSACTSLAAAGVAAAAAPSDALANPASARAARVDAELARVEALERAARYEEARAAIEPLVAATADATAPDLVARVLLAAARVDARLDARARAETRSVDAIVAAERSGDDELVARAFLAAAYEVGFQMARYERGVEWCRHAEALLSRAGVDPDLRVEHLLVLGSITWKMGKLGDAQQTLERALASLEAAGGGGLQRARALLALARVVSDRGDPGAALRMDAEGLALFEEALGPAHPRCAAVLNNMSYEALAVGRDDDALAHAKRARAIFERALGPGHRKVALALDNEASALLARGDAEGALSRLSRARVLPTSAGVGDDPMLGTVANDEAAALLRAGKPLEARSRAEEAVSLRERIFGGIHLDVALAHHTLGEALLALGDEGGAEREERRALAVVDQTAGEESLAAAEIREGLARVDMRRGRTAEAEQLLARAVACREARTSDPRALERAREALAEAHAVGSGAAGMARAR